VPINVVDDPQVKELTAPGQMMEIEEREINGRRLRTWKNAPSSLRAVLDFSLAHGDKDFMVYEDDRWTFDKHYAAVASVATWLVSDAGVQKGDRVAIAMRNYPEWSVAFWAAAISGAIVVPLNAWWTGDELEYGLRDSGSKVLIADIERFERVVQHLPTLGIDPRTSRSIRRTTRRSSTRPGRPGSPRAPWARIATSARTCLT
jgi:long-chain acyl-CoA synthetase